MKRRTAFTLIELVVVLAVIGILAALIFTANTGARESMFRKGVRADFAKFDTAIADFKALRKRLPYLLSELDVADIPKDYKSGSYLDPWGTPYVYISGIALADLPDPITRSMVTQYGMGIQPYTLSGKWPRSNPSAPTPYQILSAGPDGLFGPGGAYTPGIGAWAAGQPGADDLASFRDLPLGK